MENSISFGSLIGNPPPDRPTGSEFRIAILGDFSGRANRGECDSGDGLVDRNPIKIDFDTIDEVLERVAPRLRLPVGNSVLELEFSELDAFDADELFESNELLGEVQGIGRRVGRSVEKAVSWVQSWPESVDSTTSSSQSRGTVIPSADSLEEFSSLAGEPTASPDDDFDVSEVVQTLCGPILRGAASEDEPSRQALLAAVAECTNVAARAVLHHPDFQALEGIWRELEWLLRRVDKGGRVKVLLFDISAEEFAADLAAGDDLTETGLYRLLVDKVAEGKKPQPLSIVVGRYEFDYSRSHAGLLGRMGKICEHLNAPFLSGISSRLLAEKFKPKDEELLACWTEMRSLSSSAFVGLALPAFLLRMPYGANGRSSEKIEFEEFDSGNLPACLLWGNAGTFCAALIAGGYLKEAKWEFKPNDHRVLDKMPLHVCEDDGGEPLALTTEVEFALSAGKTAGSLGLIPLKAVKDRDSIQVSEIRSLSADDSHLRGAWVLAEAASPASSEAAVEPEDDSDSEDADTDETDPELAALLADGDDDTSSELDPELAALLGDSDEDTGSDDSDLDDLDPELRALLGE